MLTSLWRVTPKAERGLDWLESDRKAAHRMLMGGLQFHGLDPAEPRQEACMTWKVTTDRQLLVRLRSDLRLKFRDLEVVRAGDPTIGVAGEQLTTIEIDIARQYRPMVQVDPEVIEFAASRGGKINTSGALAPVASCDLHGWAEAKLRAAGVVAASLTAVEIKDIRLSRRRRERVPAARIVATVFPDPARPDALATLVHHGIGRAKNYGLGMVQVADS